MNKRKNNVKSELFENKEKNLIIKSDKLQNFDFNKDQSNFFEVVFSEICGVDIKDVKGDGLIIESSLADDQCSHSDNNTESEKRNTSLELFFQSLLKSTSEFSDEEILILQIQILKIVKNIKGKKELRQNFRKYCLASMQFRDSIMNLNGSLI